MEELAKEIRPGRLIIFEGPDGCWKDTQADLLVSEYGFIKTRLPMYWKETWKLIEQHKNNKKQGITEEYFQTLMLANYIDLFENDIKPLLDYWKDVVMTRYTASMVAYASAFWADKVFIYCLVTAIKEIIDSKYEVINILLDIPTEIALKRIEARDKRGEQKKEEIFENEKILLHVNSVYQDEVENLFDHRIPGDMSIANVHREVLKHIF